MHTAIHIRIKFVRDFHVTILFSFMLSITGRFSSLCAEQKFANYSNTNISALPKPRVKRISRVGGACNHIKAFDLPTSKNNLHLRHIGIVIQYPWVEHLISPTYWQIGQNPRSPFTISTRPLHVQSVSLVKSSHKYSVVLALHAYYIHTIKRENGRDQEWVRGWVA